MISSGGGSQNVTYCLNAGTKHLCGDWLYIGQDRLMKSNRRLDNSMSVNTQTFKTQCLPLNYDPFLNWAMVQGMTRGSLKNSLSPSWETVMNTFRFHLIISIWSNRHFNCVYKNNKLVQKCGITIFICVFLKYSNTHLLPNQQVNKCLLKLRWKCHT